MGEGLKDYCTGVGATVGKTWVVGISGAQAKRDWATAEVGLPGEWLVSLFRWHGSHVYFKDQVFVCREVTLS